MIAHHDERGGFFTLIIQPQRTVTDAQIIPRELIFIVDTSGSMSGFPIKKAKEAMRRLIKGMRSTDTFNVIRFAGDTGTLWSKPRSHTSARVDEALRYVESFRGKGGTEMRKGIQQALAQPAAEGYLRIAFLLTDGYVGNEYGIFQAIEKERRGARVFSLGVGSSVNRYLLDRAAEIGRGEAFYVRQDEDSQKVIDKFFQRVDRPTLTDIDIDWGKLDVTELYPAKIPDLWMGQPIRIHGRYTKGGVDTIVVHGRLVNRAYQQKLRVHLPTNEPAHAAMATVWARQKVHQLMNQMVREGKMDKLIEEVTQLGLTFRLMTKWTSFVAVEEKVVNVDGKPQTVVQPVEMPEGVSYEGVFGEPQPVPMAMNRMRSRGISKGMVLGRPSLYSRSPMKRKGSPEMLLPQAPSVMPSIIPQIRSPQDRANQVLGAKKAQPINITFEPGKASLTYQAKQRLNRIAARICRNIHRIGTIVITGHTDSSQADDFKEKLSRERATAVADYLVKQCANLTYSQLVIRSEADRKPIASNNTEAGREQNRRVEILIH
jgi:Ca-activated chloride channel family protein